MKVAKVMLAVNTPVTVDISVSIGKKELRVSLFDTVARCKGVLVGYTMLEKTSDTTKDRIQIGNQEYLTYEIPEVAEVNTDSIKYCICVNDVSNQWVAVVSRVMAFVLDDKTEKSGGFSICDSKALGIASALGIAAVCIIAGSISIRKKPDTEKLGGNKASTEIASVDTTTEQEFAMELSDNPTMEDYLNHDIAESLAAPDNRPKSLTQGIPTDDPESVSSGGDANDFSAGTSTSAVSIEDGNETGEKEAEQNTLAPFSSIEETVVVPPSSNEATEDDPMIVVTPPAVGSVTLSENTKTYTFVNNSDYKMTVKFKLKKRIVVEITVDSGKSKEINLFDKFSETCRPMIVYEYLNSNGKVVSSFSTKIAVYVI